MKKVVIFIYIITLTVAVFGQKWREISDLDYEGTLYLFEYQYLKSAEYFEKALSMIPESDNLKYKIGLSYYKSVDSIERAIKYFEEAAKNIAPAGTYNYTSIKELRAPIDVLFFLGRAYQALGQYQKAEALFQEFNSKTFEDDELKFLAEQQIKNMKYAEFSIKNPNNVIFESIGNHLNNGLPNYCAVFSGDGNTMAYTSSTSDGLKVYIVQKSKNGWGTPKDITWDISGGYLKTAWLSYDGKTLYLIEDNMQQNIVVSHFVDGVWGMAKKMKKPINGRGSQSSVSVSKDEKKIYFASNREGGFGGFDIYVCSMNAKGKWDDPVNLGSTINTPLNEDFVMLSDSESKLYISSEGHENIGGSDIFVWEIGSSDAPKNLGFPINNTFNNNFYFAFDDKNGVLHDVRIDGQGQTDIYSVSIGDSYKLFADIQIDNNITSDSRVDVVIKSETDPNYVQEIYQEGVGKKLLAIVPAGDYIIEFTGKDIVSHVEKISVANSGNGQDVVFQANIKTVKVIEAPIAVVENKSSAIDSLISTPESSIHEAVVAQNNEFNKPETTLISIPEKTFPVETTTEIPTNDRVITKPIVEEVKSASDIKPNIVENPKQKQTQPSNNNVNYASKVNVQSVPKITIPKQDQSQFGAYTIQFMALELPITFEEVANMGSVHVFACPDGFYRYTTGLFDSMESANEILSKVKEAYPQAFIRKIPLKGNFAIQLMALKNPKEALNVIDNINGVNMMCGSDEFYRYFIGGFETIEQANIELPKVKELGYSQAFVRKIPNN